MPYQIKFSTRANLEAVEWARFIAKDSAPAAQRWMSNLRERIRSLATKPQRFALIPEAEGLHHDYRSLFHFSHRIIYRIDEEAKTVYVVRVYHGARRPLNDRDLE